MEARPEPKLIKTKEGWHVTDGWIDGTFVRILKQPSDETIDKLHKFFVDQCKNS